MQAGALEASVMDERMNELVRAMSRHRNDSDVLLALRLFVLVCTKLTAAAAAADVYYR
jgi:hypothetical protein